MKKLMAIVMSALSVAVAFTASAETNTWTGAAGDHKWETGGNWDLNRVPNGATDDIVIGPFDEPTVISNQTAYVIEKTLTVRKNAKVSSTTNYGAKPTIGEHGRLIVEDGGQYVFDPEGSVSNPSAGFTARGSVWIYPGALVENMGCTYYASGGFGSSWRLMGGTFTFTSGDWPILNRVAVCGTDIWVGYLCPIDNVAAHVVDLISGSLKVDGHHWEGSGLWNAGYYSAGLSYVNFTKYSDAALVVKVNKAADWVYTTYFNGDKARVRYDDRCITQDEFNELFTVSSDGTYTTIRLAETADPSPESIVAQTQHVLDCVYDGDTHEAGFVAALYPRTGCVIEYSWDGGATWSDVPDRRIDAGEWQFLARVSDPSGTLSTWTSEPFTARISPKPLTDGGAVAALPNVEFTGEAITPEVVVTFTKGAETITLVRDQDYTVSYADNVNLGIATATVTGVGNYSGELKQTFVINAKLTDGDIYVDPARKISGDGSSWEKAVSSLEAVVDMLKEGDRTIYMKEGTLTFLRTIDVSGKANLTIKGGYVGDGYPGTRDPKAHASVLDGQGTKRIMNAEGCANLTLDGITFANGLAPAGTGGGALCLRESDGATVVDCTFKGNKAHSNKSWNANGGGAIYSYNGGMSVRGCRFEDNQVFGQGNNWAYPLGGAVLIDGTGARSFVNCVFLRNAAQAISEGNMAMGGAIATAASAVGATTVDNCLFIANRLLNGVAPPASFINVSLAGSAICGDNMTVRNCTIAGGAGAAIVPRETSGKVSVSNCVLAENGLDLSIKAEDNYSKDCSFSKFVLDNVIVGRTQITNAFPANCTRDVDFVFEAGCRLPAGYANIGYVFPADEPAPVWTDLYVDPTADAEGTGTEASPFKTLTAAVAAAGDWTKIHLAAGTYSASANGEVFPISIADRLGLQILGAANRGSVLDGELVVTEDKLGALLSFSKSSLVRLSNLKLTGVNREVRGGKPVGGALTAWASQLTVEDCEVSGNRFRNWDTTSVAYGAGVTLVASSSNFLGTDILDNLVYGSCPNTTFNGIGLMFYDSFGTFERGRIEGNGTDAEATIKNTTHRGAGIFAKQSQVSFRSALIAGNTFTQQPCNGAALAAAYWGGRGTTLNVILENCTINDNAGENVLYWNKTNGDTFSLVNTFVGNNDGQPAIVLGGSYVPTVLNSAFVSANACFTDGENGNILLKKGLTATFKDAADGDYHLTTGSELIKGGRNLEWFNSDSVDLYGAKRVSSRRPDIGCASLIPGFMLIIR